MYKLLYVCHLIGDLLASADIEDFGTYVGRAASYWSRTLFTPRVFLFSISLLTLWKHINR